MKAISLAGLLCFLVLVFGPSPLPANPDPPTGILGLPLGTFAVIEGVEHPWSMTSTGFAIESINGEKLGGEIHLRTEWPSSLEKRNVPGKRYVLHGYEVGNWGGEPTGLPKDEPYTGQAAGFSFSHEFIVTSIEKMDNVTVADARPLNPKVPLTKPNFNAKPDTKPPVGILGMPLGTFAIIQARAPRPPLLMESPGEVVIVNGKTLDPPLVVSIRNFKAPKDNALVTLHGFEVGEWGGEPVLPASENPPNQSRAQKAFGFVPRFLITSPPKPGI